MKKFMTSLIWITFGSSVIALAIDRAALIPASEAGMLRTPCPVYCQGDFPLPSKSQYAKSGKASSDPGV